MLKIIMPYIGGCLSKNGSRIVGRGGRRTNAYKPQTKLWMADLTEKVRGYFPGSHMTIHLFGKFVDDRSSPDLANLHEIIGDAIKRGIALDDQYYDFKDEGSLVGVVRPVIEMTLEGDGELFSDDFQCKEGITQE